MKPNPGSDEAREQGCTCPVYDNNHGKFPPWQGHYIVVQGCPLHDGSLANEDGGLQREEGG